MRGVLKVAASQYPLDNLASMDAWRDKTARWVAEGAESGARLLVFPEYGAIELAATRGAAVAADLQQTLAAVANLMPEADRHFDALAQRYDVHILQPSGPLRRKDGRFVNGARLVAPNGRAGIQVKQIMTPFERGWGVEPGHDLAVFDTALGRIGVAICYDSEFPLLVRALVEAGAELVLIPSCTERRSGFHRIRAGAAARALENTIATIVSPTVGEALWSPAVDRNAGAAGIFVPSEHALSETGVIAEGTLDAPGWVTGTIDFDALAALRKGGEMRNRADWVLQPGATPLADRVQIIDLRG
jgi:predicted amidohydrolase